LLVDTTLLSFWEGCKPKPKKVFSGLGLTGGTIRDKLSVERKTKQGDGNMFVPEEFLGQILVDGAWLDYARGTEDAARKWVATQPAGEARVVDWIDKRKVLFAS